MPSVTRNTGAPQRRRRECSFRTRRSRVCTFIHTLSASERHADHAKGAPQMRRGSVRLLAKSRPLLNSIRVGSVPIPGHLPCYVRRQLPAAIAQRLKPGHSLRPIMVSTRSATGAAAGAAAGVSTGEGPSPGVDVNVDVTRQNFKQVRARSWRQTGGAAWRDAPQRGTRLGLGPWQQRPWGQRPRPRTRCEGAGAERGGMPPAAARARSGPFGTTHELRRAQQPREQRAKFAPAHVYPRATGAASRGRRAGLLRVLRPGLRDDGAVPGAEQERLPGRRAGQVCVAKVAHGDVYVCT